VTLHVGAGTFKPVKTETMEGHEMHAEWIDVSTLFIEQLIEHLDDGIFCVGTTSVRTIESLYWMGVKAKLHAAKTIEDLEIKQWEVYEDDLFHRAISASDALNFLLNFLRDNELKRLFATTQIIIAPRYDFKIVKGMITNFHQPKSTLLLLVAAMAGKNPPTVQASWKDIYEYALTNNFRFLSYGDGCLISKST
jgi:S-adenosylmethionine:tRNA ribosyltransferase-isomerase